MLNQLYARSAMSRAMGSALGELPVPVWRCGLGQRGSYRTSALEGCSVYELWFRGRDASNGIEAVIDEVLSL